MATATGKKTGGRKKGTPNAVNREVKEAILRAFERVGGVTYLEKVAVEDHKTFCALLGKVLPMQITGEGDGPLKVELVTQFIDGNSKTPK